MLVCKEYGLYLDEDVPEEDLDLEWDEFHLKHPKIQEHEYDLLVKWTQEM